jgi:threonine/homoserine/homoserine lactone efflux protein
MELITTFLIAFLFSFVGSIPPGTLNITILWIGLEGKLTLAWRFAVAAALIEYPYGWIALRFADFVTANEYISENLKLLSGCVMIVFGYLNLSSGKSSGKLKGRLNSSGFRRGLLLGILNPMAIPFWIGVTAYLKSLHWIGLNNFSEMQAYLAGVCSGAFALLMVVALTAKNVFQDLKENKLLRTVPGLTLMVLGGYALIGFLVDNL